MIINTGMRTGIPAFYANYDAVTVQRNRSSITSADRSSDAKRADP